MYFVQIFAPALFLFATTSTTTGETNIAVSSNQTLANSSETKLTTFEYSISLRRGKNQSLGLRKIITTRLELNGNTTEQCQCTKFYWCNAGDAVTDEMGNTIPCPSNDEVCCTAPMKLITTASSVTLPNDGGTGQSNCVCVPSHQCTKKEETSAGVGLLNPRFSCASPDICCTQESINGGITGYTTTETPFDPSPTMEQQFPPVIGTSTAVECGIRYPSISTRILAPEHSSETSFGEFPWMAMLLTTETAPVGVVTNNVFVCGASLISETIVLTAAHCVHNRVPAALIVRAGEYNRLQGANEPLIHQDRQVDTISLHGEFNPRVLFNDVALVRVSEPFDFAWHVNPICSLISDSEFADPSSYNPSSCVATGWGKNASNTSDYQASLRKVDLTLVEQNECQNRLRSTELGPRFHLHASFICAGGQEGFDTCQGDGGGPLVCATKKNPSKYVQVGIVSWGIGCGNKVPGVYASVYANRDWLNQEYNSLTIFSGMSRSGTGSSSKANSSS